jgi:hypothetical protein
MPPEELQELGGAGVVVAEDEGSIIVVLLKNLKGSPSHSLTAQNNIFLRQ